MKYLIKYLMESRGARTPLVTNVSTKELNDILCIQGIYSYKDQGNGILTHTQSILSNTKFSEGSRAIERFTRKFETGEIEGLGETPLFIVLNYIEGGLDIISRLLREYPGDKGDLNGLILMPLEIEKARGRWDHSWQAEKGNLHFRIIFNWPRKKDNCNEFIGQGIIECYPQILSVLVFESLVKILGEQVICDTPYGRGITCFPLCDVSFLDSDNSGPRQRKLAGILPFPSNVGLSINCKPVKLTGTNVNAVNDTAISLQEICEIYGIRGKDITPFNILKIFVSKFRELMKDIESLSEESSDKNIRNMRQKYMNRYVGYVNNSLSGRRVRIIGQDYKQEIGEGEFSYVMPNGAIFVDKQQVDMGSFGGMRVISGF